MHIHMTLADPGFGLGEGLGYFVHAAERSCVSEANKYLAGCRSSLVALDACAFLVVKYAFSHFFGTFKKLIFM